MRAYASGPQTYASGAFSMRILELEWTDFAFHKTPMHTETWNTYDKQQIKRKLLQHHNVRKVAKLFQRSR